MRIKSNFMAIDLKAKLFTFNWSHNTNPGFCKLLKYSEFCGWHKVLKMNMVLLPAINEYCENSFIYIIKIKMLGIKLNCTLKIGGFVGFSFYDI